MYCECDLCDVLRRTEKAMLRKMSGLKLGDRESISELMTMAVYMKILW